MVNSFEFTHISEDYLLNDEDDDEYLNTEEYFIESENKYTPPIIYPCRVCGTSLNVGETPCWKCGADN